MLVVLCFCSWLQLLPTLGQSSLIALVLKMETFANPEDSEYLYFDYLSFSHEIHSFYIGWLNFVYIRSTESQLSMSSQ
jgi:hypothetical protein